MLKGEAIKMASRSIDLISKKTNYTCSILFFLNNKKQICTCSTLFVFLCRYFAQLQRCFAGLRLRANVRYNSQHCCANNVGGCCVRVGSGVQTDATTPNKFGTCSASWEEYNP